MSPSAPHSVVNMFIIFTLVLFGVVVISIATIAMLVKKSRKSSFKIKHCESNKNDNRHGSSLSSSRSYIKDCSLLKSPTSPISLSSSVLAHSPNHTHDNHTLNHTHHPHSPNSTHTPQDHRSHYLEEPVPICHQMINLEDSDNSAGVPRAQKTCVLNQDLHLTSTGACETTFLNEQREIKTESKVFGEDVSLVETSDYQSVASSLPSNIFEPQTTPKGYVHQSVYFNEAEKRAQVPFLDHRILECDCNGQEYTNTEHDIILRIPKDAVPDNKKINFEIGVALYGPFNFPENTQPISPILWLCILEEDVVLKHPFQVILPHFLTNDKLLYHQAGFAKASHNDITFQDNGQMCYSFLPCDIKPQFVFSGCRGYGILSLNHCCFYCINAKQSQELAMDAGYCLVRIEASPIPHRNVIIFSAIYFIDSCLKSLEEQFPHESGYEITRYHDFKFKDEREPYIRVVVPSKHNEHYVIAMEPSAAMIRITDIEFWNRDANDMKRRHELKMYPPRVMMTVSIRSPELTHTLPIKFEGCADNSQLDVDLTIPLEFPHLCLSSLSSSLSSGSQRFGSFHSQSRQSTTYVDTPKLQEVFKELFGLATHWKTIGTLLGLESQLLEEIKSDEESAHDRLQKMLSKWLKQIDSPPTWKYIADAVETVDATKAQEIRKQFVDSFL